MRTCIGRLFMAAWVVLIVANLTYAQTATDADFDADGQVGFVDFVMFIDAFNSAQVQFDLDGNGQVNFTDFVAFVGLFGQKAGQETIQSQISLPSGSSLKVEELKIVTPVTTVAPSTTGNTDVPTITVSKPQVVLVENAQGKPVLLGYVMPATASGKPGIRSKLAANSTVEVSTTTTAIALVMMNPLLSGSSSEQRSEIVQKVTEHSNFTMLVSLIESRLVSDSDNVLDGSGSETLYESATGILIDVLTAGLPAGKDVTTDNSEDPWLADPDASNDVVFVNPNYVYYGVGVSNRGSEDYLATQLLTTRGALFELLRWPPLKFTDESRSTPFTLADGDYTVLMTKGGAYPFSRIIDLSDPVGQATLLNFAQMIFNILDMVLSMPKVGIGDLATNLGSLKLDLNATDISTIGLAVSDGDVETVLTEIITLTINNAKNIVPWLWQSSVKPDNFAQYTSKLLPLLKNVALPLKVLAAANKVPFFYDLVAAPKEVTYEVSQTNGVLDLYSPPSEGGSAGETTTVTLSGSTQMDWVLTPFYVESHGNPRDRRRLPLQIKASHISFVRILRKSCRNRDAGRITTTITTYRK